MGLRNTLPYGVANGAATLNELGLHVPRQMPAYFGSVAEGNTWTVPFGTPVNATLSTGFLYAVPIVLLRDVTAYYIGINVTSAGGEGREIRLGIYKERDRDTNLSNLPNVDRLLDAGTVDATTTGLKQIEIEQPMTAGVYWLACISLSGNNPAPEIRCVTGYNPLVYGTSSAGDAVMPTTGAVGLRSRTTGMTNLPSHNVSASWPNLCDIFGVAPLIGLRF